MAIDDIQMFTCVSVKEPQMALPYRWGGTGKRNQGKNRKKSKDANTQNVYLWIYNRAVALSLAAAASFGTTCLGDFAQVSGYARLT